MLIKQYKTYQTIQKLPGGTIYRLANGTTGEMFFTYTDYPSADGQVLGSITHITDAAGNLLHKQSFDAWGRARNPDTYEYPDAVQTRYSASLTNDRGYTGHEMLPQFGIINMNGRLYDPILGRMLSPDPYVQMPDYSQNFNRYSYVLNNPLKFTDPSGEFWMAFAVGAVFGGITGMQIAQNYGYDAGDWQFWAYSVGGSAIGGLSGGLASKIAASGGFMANTTSMVAGSYTNSVGMAALSGGMTDVTVGFGAGSYNITQNEWGYFMESGNTLMQNVGYFYGGFANISDIIAGFDGISVSQSYKHPDENSSIGHSSLTGGEFKEATDMYDVDISVGMGDTGGMNMADKSSYTKGVATNPYWDRYYNDSEMSSGIELHNLNRSKLNNFSKNLRKEHSIIKKTVPGTDHVIKQKWYYNLTGTKAAAFKNPGFGCHSYVSKALWRVGVPNIGIAPNHLHMTLLLRNSALYNHSFYIGF